MHGEDLQEETINKMNNIKLTYLDRTVQVHECMQVTSLPVKDAVDISGGSNGLTLWQQW